MLPYLLHEWLVCCNPVVKHAGIQVCLVLVAAVKLPHAASPTCKPEHLGHWPRQVLDSRHPPDVRRD